MKGKFKKIEGAKLLTQYCLPDYTVPQCLKAIDNRFLIKSMSWAGTTRIKKARLDIPEILKKNGVSYVRHGGEKTAEGYFQNMPRKKIQDTLDKVFNDYGVVQNNCYVKKLVLSDGATELTFSRVRKELKSETDRRKKVRVLGLVRSSDPSKTMDCLSVLGSKKFACQIKKVESNIILCAEIS